MQQNFPSKVRAIALVVGVAGLLSSGLVAADPKTQMAPFKVEAEFGVDGLRIQNSVAVLNQYLLDQHGVAQMQDISGIAPNLFSSNSDSRGFGDILALRGIANSIFFSSPAVAYYIDDVPSGSVSSYPSTLLNVDSLVVKAGPQGTDYGRNAAAGVIDIKTRTPGGKHEGRFQVDRGSFNATSAQATIDGPLGAQAGYAATFGYSERDGYIDNTFLKRTADDRQAFAGRGAVYFKPTDKVQLRFGALVEKIDDDAVRLSSLFSPDPYVVSSNVNGQTSIDRQQFSFQARIKLDAGTLIATTSRQDFDLDPAINDLDLSPLPAAWSRQVQSEEMWTQEIRFESNVAPNRSQWRVGLFYLDSTNEANALREFIVPPSQFVPPGFVQTEVTDYTIGQKSLAAYGNIDVPMSDKTMLRLGARVEHAESDIDRTKTSSNNFRFPTPPEPRLVQSIDREYGALNAGITQSVSDSLSLLVRSSLAYKPEGFSGFTANPALAHFDAERLWSTEAGVTFSPKKSRFGGSLLAFWNRSSDYQFERTVPNSTDFVVVNADEVAARGFEAKFMWSPVERVWWDFQAGYTKATFETHRDATGASVAGKRVPFIPEYTLRTGVTVDFGQGWSANASYAAAGRTYFDERNTSMFSQKAYGTVNAQVRYRFERCTVSLYGQNLFEKEYYQFINPEIFAGSPGAPRRFGVQLAFEY